MSLADTYSFISNFLSTSATETTRKRIGERKENEKSTALFSGVLNMRCARHVDIFQAVGSIGAQNQRTAPVNRRMTESIGHFWFTKGLPSGDNRMCGALNSHTQTETINYNNHINASQWISIVRPPMNAIFHNARKWISPFHSVRGHDMRHGSSRNIEYKRNKFEFSVPTPVAFIPQVDSRKLELVRFNLCLQQNEILKFHVSSVSSHKWIGIFCGCWCKWIICVRLECVGTYLNVGLCALHCSLKC